MNSNERCWRNLIDGIYILLVGIETRKISALKNTQWTDFFSTKCSATTGTLNSSQESHGGFTGDFFTNPNNETEWSALPKIMVALE